MTYMYCCTNKPGFTLVELLIVSVILVLLGTIGFLSYTSYLTGVRDAHRLAQLSGLVDVLQVKKATYRLPLPDDSIRIDVDGVYVGDQGYLGTATLDILGVSDLMDPKDKIFYTYLLSKNRQKTQLMAYLEEGSTYTTDNNLSIIAPLASSGKYINRFPTVYGDQIGILLEETTLIPIQEISLFSSAGYIDVATNTGYIAYLDDTEVLSGTGLLLIGTGGID